MELLVTCGPGAQEKWENLRPGRSPRRYWQCFGNAPIGSQGDEEDLSHVGERVAWQFQKLFVSERSPLIAKQPYKTKRTCKNVQVDLNSRINMINLSDESNFCWLTIILD